MTRKLLFPLGFVIILCSLIYFQSGYFFDLYSKYFYSSSNTAHAASSNDIGSIIDEFNGVAVYYNHNVGNVSGRNLAPDGYNLGLKYQCVEFVKRYYF